MALYQGEDIAIRLSGDDVIDFENSNFWMLIYPEGREKYSVLVPKINFRKAGDNAYDFVITPEDFEITLDDGNKVPIEGSKKMSGAYSLEVMVEDGESKRRSIYRQKNAFNVERSRFAQV